MSEGGAYDVLVLFKCVSASTLGLSLEAEGKNASNEGYGGLSAR